MSRKFFSLIQGEKLHLAPGTKLVPGDSIETIMEAEKVLEKIYQQGEEYKVNVASECEILKEQAKIEGFEKGYSEWIERISNLEEEIQKVRKDVENVIFPIALTAAKKIVGKELEISKNTVIDIISQSLKSVASHKKIKIYVNRKQFELIERNKEHLKKIFENLEALSIVPQDNIEPAGCIIETEGGIINAQLENQWTILENAFQRLAKPKIKKAEENSIEKIEENPIKKPSPKKKDKAKPALEIEPEVEEEGDE